MPPDEHTPDSGNTPPEGGDGGQNQPDPKPDGQPDPSAARLRKENAFLRAGVDPDSEKGQILFDALGEDPSVEEVKAKGELIGAFATAGESTTESKPGGEEREPGEEQQARERAALAGHGFEPPPQEDPYALAGKAAQAERDQGRSAEDAVAAGFVALAKAAQDGDTRVLYGGRSGQE